MSEEKIKFSAQEQNEIKESYPSICYSCRHERRQCHEDNVREGHTGCVAGAVGIGPQRQPFIEDTSEEYIGEGWIYSKLYTFGNPDAFGSGVMTNCMPITRRVLKCKDYEAKSED